MEESLLTKCPHCRTLFRIKMDHLAAASGEVRCGVCFKVFNAQQQGVSYSAGTGSDADTTYGRKPAVEEQVEGRAPVPDHTKFKKKSKKKIIAAPSSDELDQLEIENESVEAMLYGGTASKRNKQIGLWSSLSILGVFILLLQFAWYNRELYAHQAQWHSWYKAACATFNCDLPEYHDLTRVRTERLEVKSHPDYNNVLIIDIILNNQGNLPQSFPTLELSFFDIDGQRLAQRNFAPDEYTDNREQALSMLPVEQPVRVSFTILDPGQRAVNYSVSLHGNES